MKFVGPEAHVATDADADADVDANVDANLL